MKYITKINGRTFKATQIGDTVRLTVDGRQVDLYEHENFASAARSFGTIIDVLNIVSKEAQ